MKLTVLGSGNVFSSGNRAGSGYLVEANGKALVVDLGFGAFINLKKKIPVEKVSAIFFSHIVHVDHGMDLIAFLENRYASTKFRGAEKKQLNLFGPKGFKEFYQRIVELYPHFKEMPFPVKIEELDYSNKKFFGFLIKTKPVKHVDYTVGYRIEVGGNALAYSADSDVCSELVDLGKDVGLFILDAGCGKEKITDKHMTFAEAAEIASRAGAKKALFSHIDQELSGKEIKSIVSEKFKGGIIVAKDLLEVEI